MKGHKGGLGDLGNVSWAEGAAEIWDSFSTYPNRWEEDYYLTNIDGRPKWQSSDQLPWIGFWLGGRYVQGLLRLDVPISLSLHRLGVLDEIKPDLIGQAGGAGTPITISGIQWESGGVDGVVDSDLFPYFAHILLWHRETGRFLPSHTAMANWLLSPECPIEAGDWLPRELYALRTIVNHSQNPHSGIDEDPFRGYGEDIDWHWVLRNITPFDDEPVAIDPNISVINRRSL